MAPDRGTGPSPAAAFEVVLAETGAARQGLRADVFDQPGAVWRQVDDDPVREDALGCRGVGSVRILDQQRQALRIRGNAAPVERGGHILAVPREPLRNGLFIPKSR